MKNNINYILASFVLLGLLTSCNDDDLTGEALLKDYSPSTVTLSSSSPTVFNESAINEDDPSTYQIEVTASIPSPQPINAVINLYQSGGTADASDFELHSITIPAGDTSASATVDIMQTGDIEGTETLEIQGKAVSNFNVAPFTLSVTIEDDYINNNLDLVLSWDGSAEDGDLTIASFCDIDFDLLLFDSAFAFVGYVLGSAACPEEGSLSGLADGVYYLVSDLYSNPYSGLGLQDTLPLTLSWSQEYFDETSGSISTDQYTLSSADGLGGLIVVLEVSNGYEYSLSPF